jgi:hypothetical protein
LKPLDVASFCTKQIVDGFKGSDRDESWDEPSREGLDVEPSNGRAMISSLVLASSAEPKSPKRSRPGRLRSS